MEEEKVELKETVESPAEAPVANDENTPEKVKSALVGFILALVGFTLAWEPVVSVAAIILGFVGFGQAKKAGNITKKPHQIFKNIAKPVGLVAGISGIIMTIVYTISLITTIIAAIVAAGANV